MYYFRLAMWILGIAAVILIAVAIFGGGKPAPVNPLKPLPDYATTDATVSVTTDGIVNGDEMHRQIRVTISSTQRSVDVIQGYSGQVISSKDFYNSGDAYSVFLKALNNSGFLLKSKNSKIPSDPAGYCPLGERYILKLNQEGDDLFSSWASTCGGKTGNSTAPIQTILALFQDQIPGYQTLVSQVNLEATSTQ
ncbi:MAG TPA: hypothetical protein VFP32_02840 [Candidatus Saccharimonadales bacterium]|nr:hypothetical protein [Candidatus Saccharimonadales bacterium]